jgi:hypothetical protein
MVYGAIWIVGQKGQRAPNCWIFGFSMGSAGGNAAGLGDSLSGDGD